MPTVTLFNTQKEEVGSIELADSIFGVTVREHLFYEAVRYQLAKRRSGNHSVKGRAEISGGGKKPFRQKGTGQGELAQVLLVPRIGVAVGSYMVRIKEVITLK